MVIGKIKPTATIVAQFAAGVEIEVIQHDGKMFLPMVSMGDFTFEEKPTESKKTETPIEKSAPAVSTVSEAKKEKPKKEYTLDELMETDTKDLSSILKDEFGINPDEYPGKNTNKKLRELILNAQSDDKGDDTESDDNEKDLDAYNAIVEILEDFDHGKKNKRNTISAICELGPVNKDDVIELIDKFESDANLDIDNMASQIEAKFGGAAKNTSEKLVSVDDLKVGDRVSVWWNDDNQDWFSGEVKSIRKGKVTVSYDDGTEDVIDPEICTKIKLLAD